VTSGGGGRRRGPLDDGAGGRTTACRPPAPAPSPPAVAIPMIRCSRWSAERGQASLELLGVLPALLALALAVSQIFAVGYASVLAGNAAEAGALALAAGADAEAGVREALPGWSRAGARVSVQNGEVTVRLHPPSALKALAERLEVTGKAAVELP
jgi:hypothetical protein